MDIPGISRSGHFAGSLEAARPQLFLFSKRAIAQILATLDLSHLPAYALKYWNTLFTQISKHLQSHATLLSDAQHAWLSPK